MLELAVSPARAIVIERGAAVAVEHAHMGPQSRVLRPRHPVVRTLVWRPLTVGLIHRLAGSGALTAIAFAELPGCWRAAPVHDPFGSSSIAGMALGSGAAG
ncbi:MAG TPA: hypothetical protein VGD37_15935, partial [Kofleriaceae bacterium]